MNDTKTNTIESGNGHLQSAHCLIVIKRWDFCSSSEVKQCNHFSIFACWFLLIAELIAVANQRLRWALPHNSILSLLWLEEMLQTFNKKVCLENCLWWLRRIIFNSLQVSNKQMNRALQIITWVFEVHALIACDFIFSPPPCPSVLNCSYAWNILSGPGLLLCGPSWQCKGPFTQNAFLHPSPLFFNCFPI